MNVADLIDAVLSGPFVQQLVQILGVIVFLAACFAVIFSIVGSRFKTSFVRVLAVAFGLSSILHFALKEGKEADEAELQQSYDAFNRDHANLLHELDETQTSTQAQLGELTDRETISDDDVDEINSLEWLLKAIQRFAASANNLSIDSLPAEAIALTAFVERLGEGDILRPNELAQVVELFSEFEILHTNLEVILEKRGEVRNNEDFVGAYSWFILLILLGGAMEIGSECRNFVPSFKKRDKPEGVKKSVEERLADLEKAFSKMALENEQIERSEETPSSDQV
ncbi:MAG: hypothetical protein AAFY75_09375 [Pseudomonadota bacterium]